MTTAAHCAPDQDLIHWRPFTLIMSMFRALLLSLALLPTLASAQTSQPLPTKVAERLKEKGFHANDLDDCVLMDSYTTARNGMLHAYYRQRWQGIEVWNGDIAVHQLPSGEVIQLRSNALSGIGKRVNTTTPVLSPQDALRQVLAKNLPGVRMPALLRAEEGGKLYLFSSDGLGDEPVRVKLVFQIQGEKALLAWNVNHYTPDGTHWWNVRIDAVTGEELDRNDWVSQCAFDHPHGDEHACTPAIAAPAAPNDYNVFDWPVESPNHGSRTLSNAPWLDGGIASPFGWHDTDGAAGPEYTDTRGNNCRAQEDADANNTGGTRPSGGANLDFDFPLDFSGAPSTYLPAATTNLFYWNNLMHDVWYQYGFDEPAGNFQENNYGRGGSGNDWVYADAQDGSGTDNANFGTPPDGSSPRMQMYRWTYTTPNRDSDLDNGIIAHEYGHGISNRLVGGPSNTSCLGNAEQMGEGWSDFFSLVMTIKSGDTGPMPRGVGTYVLGEPTTGGGIRPSPYSTNFGVNAYTYADINSGLSQPHGIGFVWCTMLWEMTWELINTYGLDPDIYNGTGGNNLAMQLVIDGMKLTPCNPGFVDARDAILLADQVNNGGANQNAIWAAFARRGLGVSADQGSSNSRSDQTEAFDTPLPVNIGVSQVISPSGNLLDCAAADLPVTVVVRNFGQSAQTNFEVRYQLDGGSWVSENYPGTLSPGASADFTFSQHLSIVGNGAHALLAGTNLPGDGYLADDSFTANLSVSSPTTVNATYEEDVEATSPTPTGWTLENPDNGNTWVTKAVSGQTSCVGTRAWAIDNYSSNTPGQEDRLVSPVVSLAGSAGSRLKFQHAYSGYSSSYIDELRAEISVDCGLSWITLWQASGSALQTTPYVTASWTPNSCSQWLAHDIDISAYDGGDAVFRFTAVNGFGNWLYLDDVVVERNGVRVALTLMLGGAYDEATNLMRDDLRTAGQLPLTEPYTALGYVQAGGGGGESVDAAVLAASGNDAVVDWVLVELRSAGDPASVVATRCALIQRDGDVVDKDGASPISFQAGNGSYYIAVRHRNHLGAMTSAAQPLTTSPLSVDFSVPAASTFGSGAQQAVGSRMVLWSGNVTADDALRYTGEDNDRDPILQAIGGSVPTNVSAAGYHIQDVNMDAVIRYVGEDNDRDPILLNIGGSVPTNTRSEQLP